MWTVLGKFLSFICLIWTFTSSAYAVERYGPEAGVIPYGMGRAYSAAADDWLSLYYNPAGLAMVEGVDLQIFDLNFGVNKDGLTKYNDYRDLGKSGNSSQKLQVLSGKQLSANLSNYTQLTIPKFAAALIYNYSLSFNNKNQAFPVTRIRDTEDFGFMTGFGIGMGRANNRSKSLRLGASFKYIKRKGTIKEVSVAQLGSDTDAFLRQFQQSGWGLGADLGMQYQLPVSGRIEYTFSYVYHDVGKTSFGSYTQLDRPARLEENMIAGFAVRFPIGGGANRRVARRYGQKRSSSHLTLAADYSHINISTNKMQLPLHMHFGANLELPIISIQGGLNQTFFTYGITADFKSLRISAASYAEELGSYAGQQRDRRYILSIGSGFGFTNL